MKKVYICDDNITGIFSAVYDAWKERRGGEAGIELKGMLERQLFCEYVEVEAESRKAAAVERLILKHLGYNAYWELYHALLSCDPGKGEAALHVIQAARTVKNSKKIMEHLTNPDVAKVFELSRNVSNEAHLFKEFIRFRELENGVLFSEIAPKNQVLPCIGDHFSDRFPLENWAVYDKSHRQFLVHRAKENQGKNFAGVPGKAGDPIFIRDWILVEGEELNRDGVEKISASELKFERLWKGFFEAVSIRERENPRCQRTHLPIHFRQDMTEFKNDRTFSI